MLCSEHQNKTEFEIHLEKFQSGLNVKNENLKNSLIMLKSIVLVSK